MSLGMTPPPPPVSTALYSKQPISHMINATPLALSINLTPLEMQVQEGSGYIGS